MKKVTAIHRHPKSRWVGDGFPVRTIFSYRHLAAEMSPFLLLDYVGPAVFKPSNEARGVDPHPHRGLETVTLVYSGDLEHRDSGGHEGVIRAGGVQWMTAASGLVHEERHGRALTENGGNLEAVQLWVNLKANDKWARPALQNLAASQIPEVVLASEAGTVRVIAGNYRNVDGPARTFTPINLWDARLNAGHSVEFRVPMSHTSAIFVMQGEVRLENGQLLGEAELAIFDRHGSRIGLEILSNTTLLVLDGQPINEPIAGHGPFVMNVEEDIHRAWDDYEAGRMGRLHPTPSPV